MSTTDSQDIFITRGTVTKPSNKTLEPTATARLARTGFGFKFAPVAFWLALPVAVAQLFRWAE